MSNRTYRSLCADPFLGIFVKYLDPFNILGGLTYVWFYLKI